MLIVADENIPLVSEFFSGFGEVRTYPGRTLTADDVAQADALVVRSVTQVNKALLEGSKVRFVGTCTIGVDHLDIEYLEAQGIGYASAPGCNANSVVEYVFSVLANLRPQWQTLSFGIIGCGNVGGALYQRLKTLGLNASFYDPLLNLEARQELSGDDSVSLEEVLACDVVCCHAPLTKAGKHPSYHLLGEAELASLKPNALLINAGRGAVIDNQDLLKVMASRPDLCVALDVWEGEPDINMALLPKVHMASPHIAGYSFDGKVAGTAMIYRALCDAFELEATLAPADFLGDSAVGTIDLGVDEVPEVNEIILAAYDVADDDRRMRRALFDALENQDLQESVSEAFDRLRKQYPERREFFVRPLLVGSEALAGKLLTEKALSGIELSEKADAENVDEQLAAAKSVAASGAGSTAVAALGTLRDLGFVLTTEAC